MPARTGGRFERNLQEGPLGIGKLYDDPMTMSIGVRPHRATGSSAASARAQRPEAAAPAGAAEPPLTALRLSDQLAERVAAQIESGSLHPGDRLPTEQQLAVAHGVSRTVVREAVHQLKSRGLLRSRQGSGMYVAAPVRRGLALEVEALDPNRLVAQIAEVRRALEGEIAALAAERATRRQAAAIRRAALALERAVAAGGDGIEEDLAFHRLIAEATGNPQFGRILGFLEQYLRDAMQLMRGNDLRHDHLAAVHAEHLAIADAIVAGDPGAARRQALRHMARGQARLQQGGLIPTVRRPAARSRPRGDTTPP